MDPSEGEFNGCWCMLSSGLAVWHGALGDDARRRAAMGLKTLYEYEYHMAGLGCPWRTPGFDMERTRGAWGPLGLDLDDVAASARACARLLDGDPKDFERMTGRSAPEPSPRPLDPADRFGVAEQFHNALRRVTPDRGMALRRETMAANLGRMIPLAAHMVRVERDGGEPDPTPLLALCRRTPPRTGAGAGPRLSGVATCDTR